MVLVVTGDVVGVDDDDGDDDDDDDDDDAWLSAVCCGSGKCGTPYLEVAYP